MTQTCASCRSCVRMVDRPGTGLCRRRRPDVFREIEVVQAGDQPPKVTVHVHSHYPFIALADVGCDDYRPQLGRLGRAIVRAWRFVVAL